MAIVVCSFIFWIRTKRRDYCFLWEPNPDDDCFNHFQDDTEGAFLGAWISSVRQRHDSGEFSASVLILTPHGPGHSRAGGTATVFENYFTIYFIIFLLFWNDLVWSGLFWSGALYSKEFVYNFSEFLVRIMSKNDHVLIVGVFNIHV